MMILAAEWYHNILATVFGLFAVLLIGVILLQRGKGVGLSGAFGGTGGHTAFGAKTGDVLTWATIGIASGLLIFTIVLNFVFTPLQAFDTTPAPAVAPTTGLTPDSSAADSGPDAAGTESSAPAEAPPPEAPTPSATPAGGGETPAWSRTRLIFGAANA